MQVSSRARETLCFFMNLRLVYAKHYFFASSRMGLRHQAPCASWKEAPRRPGPVTGRSSHFFCEPSAAKLHQNSSSKNWPGPLGSLNVRIWLLQTSQTEIWGRRRRATGGDEAAPQGSLGCRYFLAVALCGCGWEQS